MNMELKLSSIVLELRAIDQISLPPYKGSALRGGFGHAFKRVVCAVKDKECQACLLREKCIYSYTFETPPPSDTKIMRTYKAAPHPFVIEPPPERKRDYKPGEIIRFGLVLIGRAVDYLPYFIFAFHELGNMGIGKGRGKYELAAAYSAKDTGDPIYLAETRKLKPITPQSFSVALSMNGRAPSSTKLTLEFLTPSRLVFDGHFVFDLEFHMFIRQLLRRLSLLSYFHCGADLSNVDFKGIIERAEAVKVSKRKLRWYDWERYSMRQDTRMKMGGFVGEVEFEGDIRPFLPLIQAGEALHVGKGTSFGLGKYEIL